MIVATTDSLHGHRITETLGLVQGTTVRARHVGRSLLAGLRQIAGGEVIEYTKVIAEAREQALDRMKDNARSLDADAVVCFRFGTSEVANGAAEVVAYGTAVKVSAD